MAEEIKIPIDETYMNVIKFGHGGKNLVIISGISLCGLEGQGNAIEGAYKCFDSEYTCYLFDRKKVLPEGYSIGDLAGDVYNVLCRLGVASADFFGVSQGGMIALSLAIDHPGTVNKAVIASSAARLNDSMKKIFADWKKLALSYDVRALNRNFFEHVYSEAYRDEYKEAFDYLENVGTSDDCRRIAILSDACIDFDVFERLSEIRCPVLVIGDRDDRIFPADICAHDMADGIGCQIFIYKGYGHAVYDEAPDFKERIMRFFRGEDARA